MKVFKIIRKNTLINKFFRQILKFSWNLANDVYLYLIKRWSPSGIINCTFENIAFKLYNESDDGLPYYFYYNEPYPEKADLKLFLALAQKSKTIVDVGANTGLFSVLAAIVNPKSQILAFEPYHSNAERFKVNMKANSIGNVQLHEIAIGNLNGEIQFAVPENEIVNDVSSLNMDFSKSIYPEIKWVNKSVKISKLDDFAVEQKICIDLIKCDVESFEMSVFQGADRILREDRPTIIFECFLDEERKEFFNQILTKYSYYAYLILEQGIVYTKEGFLSSEGLNYLISPVIPAQTFISYHNPEELNRRLLLRPEKSNISFTQALS